ncbi:unnamed protein product [Rotaria sordida]|uniref:UNC93-like protein n=1 Tax=Rotaria sordida TaxID=392033 RepID=A0A819DCP4_9BILA|nr:unnamed protein product [Rotaria sordida]
MTEIDNEAEIASRKNTFTNSIGEIRSRTSSIVNIIADHFHTSINSVIPIVIEEIDDDNDDELPLFSIRQIYKNLIIFALNFVLLFTAYGSISVLQSSLNTEGNVGVNSLIVSNAFFLVSSIFLTHMLIDIFGLKWTTIICEIGFIFYIIANIRPLPSLMYISAGLVGLGAGPLWTSQATYISHIARYYAHRKEKKVDVIVSLFFGIFYAIYYTNLIWGNLLSYLVLNRSSQSQNFNCGIHFDPLSQTKTGASSNVSDVTRYVLCGIFAGMGVVSIILLVLALDQIRLAKPQSVRQSLKKSIELLQSLIKWKHLNQLFLAPLIIWSTMEHAFLVAQFTRAFITCLVGIRFIGLVLMCNAGLWGVAAAAWQSQIIVFLSAAYTVLYADDDPSALAKYRLWQSIGALSTYSYASYVTIQMTLIILFSCLTVSMIFYCGVEIHVRWKKNRRKPTIVNDHC